MNDARPRPKVPARELAVALRRRQGVPDGAFDAHIPWRYRVASSRFWTPITVARRAASWFEEAGAQRVLDVGSGVGKLCVVGALSTLAPSFTGVEQRPHLVAAARGLASRFGVQERAAFVEGTLEAVRFESFDALYFYNPFGENLSVDDQDQLDGTVELSSSRFARDVAAVQEILGRLPVGTCFVTYHGFGGRIPDTYDPVRTERTATSALRLWSRTRAESDGGYWLEPDDTMLFGQMAPRRVGGGEVEEAELQAAPL